MFLFQLIIEPSSGLGVAAVMSEKMRNMDHSMKHIAVILCGGNVDIDNLPWWRTKHGTHMDNAVHIFAKFEI